MGRQGLIHSETDDEQAAVKVNLDRVGYLNSRVAELYRSGVTSAELGNIALELLALRNDIETRKTENSTEALGQLRELEKMVISLYMLNILGEKKPKVTDYLFREYAIYER
jgi:hypothetical protein